MHLDAARQGIRAQGKILPDSPSPRLLRGIELALSNLGNSTRLGTFEHSLVPSGEPLLFVMPGGSDLGSSLAG